MPKTNILKKIVAQKRRELETRMRQTSPKVLAGLAREMPAPRSLANAIRGKDRLAIIAEIKKASPSAGIIRRDFDPVKIAAGYTEAGADALSVLTDEQFFQGSLEHIRQIRPDVDVPVLRKDFIIDRYQLLEARAYGADAALLIVAALAEGALVKLLEVAKNMGLETLVEVHTEEELKVALGAGAEIIGINNRNLETFAIDLATTERLAAKIPPGKIIVSESGISGIDDLKRIHAVGADAVLIGSHFMAQDDPGRALADFKEIVHRDKK